MMAAIRRSSHRAALCYLRPWHIVGLVALAYIALTLARHGGNPIQFALVGSRFDPGVAGGTWGYDGQFAYQIARDPLGASRFLDVPAYRYQRILYPLVVWALALGQKALVPWALIAVNWLALVAGTWLTEEILAGRGVSRWYALSYGLFAGLMMGVRLDLTEPLAYALAQAAVLTYERGRWRGAAVLLALAALTKETTLLVAAGFFLSLTLSRRWRDLIEWAVIVGAPFAAWQVILRAWLGAWGVGSGGALATLFEWIPYRGLWSLELSNLKVAALIVLAISMALLPALLALVVALRDVLQGDRHPFVCVLLINALIVPFTPQSTMREPLGMARLIVGLVAAVILWGAYRKSRRALNYSLLWIATLVLAINESQLPA
jgi:hypothetical protein